MAETKINENMALWNAVCTTDPAQTKPVKYGQREYTTVDAYYQIKKATEQWGRLGAGWKAEHSIIHFDERQLIILVELCYKIGERKDADGNTVIIWSSPIYGYGNVSINPEKTNHALNDSHKKCFTDGMTKALSYLGFDYDVFSGKFNDNKHLDFANENGGKGEPKKKQLKGPATVNQKNLVKKLIKETDSTDSRADEVRNLMGVATVTETYIDTLSKQQASDIIEILKGEKKNSGNGKSNTSKQENNKGTDEGNGVQDKSGNSETRDKRIASIHRYCDEIEFTGNRRSLILGMFSIKDLDELTKLTDEQLEKLDHRLSEELDKQVSAK